MPRYIVDGYWIYYNRQLIEIDALDEDHAKKIFGSVGFLKQATDISVVSVKLAPSGTPA